MSPYDMLAYGILTLTGILIGFCVSLYVMGDSYENEVAHAQVLRRASRRRRRQGGF